MMGAVASSDERPQRGIDGRHGPAFWFDRLGDAVPRKTSREPRGRARTMLSALPRDRHPHRKWLSRAQFSWRPEPVRLRALKVTRPRAGKRELRGKTWERS